MKNKEEIHYGCTTFLARNESSTEMYACVTTHFHSFFLSQPNVEAGKGQSCQAFSEIYIPQPTNLSNW